MPNQVKPLSLGQIALLQEIQRMLNENIQWSDTNTGELQNILDLIEQTLSNN